MEQYKWNDTINSIFKLVSYLLQYSSELFWFYQEIIYYGRGLQMGKKINIFLHYPYNWTIIKYLVDEYIFDQISPQLAQINGVKSINHYCCFPPLNHSNPPAPYNRKIICISSLIEVKICWPKFVQSLLQTLAKIYKCPTKY